MSIYLKNYPFPPKPSMPSSLILLPQLSLSPPPNLSTLIDTCSSKHQLNQLLPHLIKQNLHTHHFYQSKLLSLFTKFTSLTHALTFFQTIENKPDDSIYHSLLKSHAQQSSLQSTLRFFIKMKYDGVQHNVYDFTYLIKSCADEFNVRIGKEVQAQIVVNGFGSNLFAMTGVVNMYVKCGCLDDACKVFDRMPERDFVSWNTLISGFGKNGFPEKALGLVRRMEGSLDMVTVVSVLPAVSSLGDLRVGREVHGFVLRRGLEGFVNVGTALLGMYAKCGDVKGSRRVFDGMGDRTVVSWNSLIDGYVQSGECKEALGLFRKMMDDGVEPSNVTAMAVLHACGELGDVKTGRYVHELVDRFRLGSDVSVVNSLISMYCKCKRVDLAAQLFDELKRKTLVTWNAMILGYAQSGRPVEAIGLFCKMQKENISPDSFTLVSVMTAVADLSVLRRAKWIHGVSIRSCFDKNAFVMTALVDMYAKCGGVHTARKLFDSMRERHVTTWNAMIDGYGTHGFGKEASELFEEMCKGSINPNGVTFLCIISGCSHSGLVDEGRRYFDIMKEEYGLEPSMDHYGAMVDLLGRAGKLDEAWEFIQKMPVEPAINVYGAMLGACKIHKNVDLGEKAADKLFELEPEDGGYHVLLANIYAIASMWEKVAKVRTLMEKTGIQKTPGCSLVDLKNEVHTFYSGSTRHPQSEKIYAYLEKLIDRIKLAGYIPDTSSIHDVEDDVQEQLLNTHSEKLAISFGLINTTPGTTIHIRKNLRVCGDCHNATKYISLVTEREIIVRDMHRFHHFKNGTCSCGDYW